MLSVAGLAAYAYAPWIAGLVALVMIVVVLSYRQNVHAYPSGGGDYEVVTKNLGPTYGLLVASALLVDYILTVAVSTAAGVANIGSAVQIVGDHPVWFSIGIIVLVCAANLRGIRESGSAFAIPVYAFIFSIFAMIITGLVEFVDRRRRPGAEREFPPAGGIRAGRFRPGLPAAARLLLRVGRADRRRGHLQRCARVQEAEVEERRDHPRR